MLIKLNGDMVDIPSDMDVLSLIESKKLDPKSVIVELNMKIIGSDQWTDTIINENDSIEVLRFVGGG